MGWDLKSNPHLIRLMSPQDQARYGGISGPFYEQHPECAPQEPKKADPLERDAQRQFCNWCLLHYLPFVWHQTHKRSTANIGCPDFVVGIGGKVLFLEFKRDRYCQLTQEQEAFRQNCLRQGLVYRVVYSAAEAIKLLEECDSL